MQASEECCFPFVVAMGRTRIFRVQAVGVNAYHVQQQQPMGDWKTLAITNQDMQEAIDTMHDAQAYYITELQKRRQMSQNLQGGLNGPS